MAIHEKTWQGSLVLLHAVLAAEIDALPRANLAILKTAKGGRLTPVGFKNGFPDILRGVK